MYRRHSTSTRNTRLPGRKHVPATCSKRAILCLLLAACAFLAVLPPAAAQNRDESILLDLKVNYGVAFREGSWVPVDVFVNNTERDVDGYVEVRTYDFSNTLQSPTYRLPIVSPKNSRKRFRLHCQLERTDRLEVQVYHGGRAATPVPAWVNLTPIDRNDYLGLVLDDQHHDYGFLSSAAVIGKPNTRFHREGLATAELGYLADHFPCYTTFDLIVLGNIDPERIGAAHRELIKRYVSLGGSLAINLGQNANQYKGSWLEPLMGVEIGESRFMPEATLAGNAFGATTTGREPREGMVTRLTPANDTVRPIGNDYSAGAIHKVGAGQVATFNVDAVSGLLQNNADYLDAWNRLLQQNAAARPMNLPGLVQMATMQLPTIAGVKLFPVSSVIAYLLLYFFIAIVGNWLFWNWMKRREMAWVCLVFFSLAFTSYAMIFGTQGRARTTELEQLEVLELGSNSPVATLHGITGLLAKGSGRFDANLIHPETLVTDASRANAVDTRQVPGMFGSQGESPFHFVQGDAGQIHNLAVGASEMRFVQSQTPIELDGPLASELVVEGKRLRGAIWNDTGLALISPVLLYDGNEHRLSFEDGVAHIDLEIDRGTRPPRIDPTQFNASNPYYPNAGLDYAYQGSRPQSTAMAAAITAPDDMEPQFRNQFANFLASLPQVLLQTRVASPPCIIAWAKREPFGTLDLGDRAEVQLGATMVIAWLDIKRDELPSSYDLAITLTNPDYGNRYGNSGFGVRGTRGDADMAEGWQRGAQFIAPGASWNIGIAIPDWLRRTEDYALELAVTTDENIYSGYHGECEPRHLAEEDKRLAMEFSGQDNTAVSIGSPRESTSDLEGDTTLVTQTYTADNWQSLILPRASVIDLKATATSDLGPGLGVPAQGRPIGWRGGPDDGMRHYHATISARMVKINAENTGE